MTGSESIYYEDGTLLMDVRALKDISPDDELLMDYGQDWSLVWESHLQNWDMPQGSELYTSVSQLLETHSNTLKSNLLSNKRQTHETISLEDEFDGRRNAETIMTACYFSSRNTAEEDNSIERRCLWPCTILQQFTITDTTMYKVRLEDVDDGKFDTYCDEKIDINTDYDLPEQDVRLVDKPYTSDQFLPQAFRQEIGLSLDIIPSKWLKVNDSSNGDFYVPSSFEHGWIDHIRWKTDQEVVSPNAYLLGLSQETRDKLLQYAEERGVVELAKEATFRGNSLPLGEEKEVSLQGMRWLLRATDAKYNSDMHWISPLDEEAQTNFLQALSAAGFDSILDSIGKYFGFEGLACYSLTFIAVSKCQKMLSSPRHAWYKSQSRHVACFQHHHTIDAEQ